MTLIGVSKAFKFARYGVVYAARGDGPIKIGLTTALHPRLMAIGTEKRQALSLVEAVVLRFDEACVATEAWMHDRFHKHSLGREWFDIEPKAVCDAFEFFVQEIGDRRARLFAPAVSRLQERAWIEPGDPRSLLRQ